MVASVARPQAVVARVRQPEPVTSADQSGATSYWTSGSGHAGGYGYHKESSAIADAISSAGVTLQDLENDRKDHWFDLSGTGTSYYPQVFDAIVRAAGYRGRTLLVSH